MATRNIRQEADALEQMNHADEWRTDTRVSRGWSFGKLQRRVARAAIDFEIAAGFNTRENVEGWFNGRPSDWPKYGPTNVIPYNFQNNPPRIEGEMTKEERFRLTTETFLRMAGWLRGASEFPTLVEFIKSTQCGMFHSPYNLVNLWDFARIHKSPGAADFYLRKVAYQCNRFLRGYGLSFRGSWAQVPYSLRNARKAGKVTAANVLRNRVGRMSWQSLNVARATETLLMCRGFQIARRYEQHRVHWAVESVNERKFPSLADALLVSESCLLEDTTDGVKLLLDPMKTEIKGHIAVCTGYGTFQAGGKKSVGKTFLVRSEDGRTFHTSEAYHYDQETKRRYTGVRAVIKQAIEAWKNQEKYEQAHPELMSILKPANVSWLVTRQDSYSAGNCGQGTEAWLQGVGMTGRAYVPVDVLIRHVGNPRVSAVLNVVAERARQDLAA